MKCCEKLNRFNTYEIYCITSRDDSLKKQNSVEALTTRFNEIYRVIVYLEKIGRKNYLLDPLRSWWIKINISILQFMLLFPKVIRVHGVIL